MDKIIHMDGNYTQHQIYWGDYKDSLKQISEKSIDMIFADPPYNLQLKNNLHRPDNSKVNGVNDNWDKFDSFKEYDDFTKNWLSGCRKVMKDNATIWVIGSYHNIFRVGKIMMDMGFWILNDIQWHKNNPMPNFKGVRFTNATETLIWAKKTENQKKYTFNYKEMKNMNDGKQMTSVWKIPVCRGHERIKNKDGVKAHPTQKPEKLLERVILSSTNKGDRVLDMFSGTGTTAVVCKKYSRKSISIDKERTYHDILINRLDKIDSQKKLFESGC